METPLPTVRVTQRDVARALGLTQATISMALRDDPRIPDSRRTEIREAAETMGYRPNPSVSALAHFMRTAKSKPVQAALAWFNFWPKPRELRSYLEFDRYWRGAAAAAEKLGYHLEEFVGDERMTPHRLESILVARGINGILLPPHGPHSPDWGDFRWDRFSAVRFGRSVQVPRIHLVTADQVANAMLAFAETRKRGYERIGFAANIQASARGALFDAGFLRARRSVDESQRLRIFGVDSVRRTSETQADFARWMKKNRPDALLTDVHFMPEMLKKAGYRVPEDVGLVAMSVLDGGADAGIYQNPEEIGRVAVLVLASLIHDNDRGIPATFRQILVEGAWVDGTSLPRRG